ncbi:MAG: hypothetical protein LBH50_05740 [Spirochaetaceae bacterium]|jgi:hypothetical protein|nr:hypothetical protein [Spirochaetaceae bacterium]
MNKRRIKIFVTLYEHLLLLREDVINFLSEKLPFLYSERWWEEGVVNAYVIHNQTLYDDIHSLSGFDFSELLNILIYNWENIVLARNSVDSVPDNRSLRLFYKMKTIRNDLAHPNDNKIRSSDFKKYIGYFTEFSKIISNNAAYIEKLNRYVKFEKYENSDMDLEQKKLRIIKLIEDEVIEPALSCDTLDEDVKESLVGTLIKFEILNSLEDINAFFSRSLLSPSGKNIYKLLHENNLKAFEDILGKYNEIYYS